MSDAVIIALISAIAGGLPTLATIVTAHMQKKHNDRDFAKQTIFRLIDEDKTEALYGHMPANYQNILHEYDVYHANGGNSYVTEKVEQYKKWYVEWQTEHIDHEPEEAQ